MPEAQSEFYIKYPDEIKYRLDASYYHPKYDEIEILLSKVKFNPIEVGHRKILVNITKGKTPKGIIYIDEGIPFLRAGNIINEEIDVNGAPRIDQIWHASSQLHKSQLKKNNVLVTMAGTIGECAVYNLDDECNCNQAISILTVDTKEIFPKFLVKCLNSRLGKLQFGKLQKIADQPNVGFEEIKIIRIPCPATLKEQEKIVSQVKKIEDKIPIIDNKIDSIKFEASNHMLNELGIRISVAANNRQYFFKTGKDERSPYFTQFDEQLDRMDYHFHDPELQIVHHLREKFSTITMGEIVESPIVRGEQPEYIDETESVSPDETIDVIKTVDMKDSHIDYENCLKTKREFFDKYPAAQQLKKNDVLMSSTGYVSMGKVDVFDRNEQENPAFADGHIAIIRLKEGYDPYFVTYYLRSHFGKQQIERWWNGSSGQIELKTTDISNFIIPENSEKGIPSTLQMIIADKISKKLGEIKQLELQKEIIISKARKEFACMVGIS